MSELDDLIRAEERRWAQQIRTRLREESDVIYDSILRRGEKERRSSIIWHWAISIIGGAFVLWLISFVWWILEGGLR